MSVLDYFRPKTKEKLMRGERVHWVENNPRARYIRACVLSFPPWADRQAMQQVFDAARALETLTGIKHTIDHIVPLNHERVCGLSVHYNMRPLPSAVNSSKGNYWCPEQIELFEHA
jgi:hypothetical protein